MTERGDAAVMFDPATARFASRGVLRQWRDGVPCSAPTCACDTHERLPVVLAKSALRDLGAFRVPGRLRQTLFRSSSAGAGAGLRPTLVNVVQQRAVIWRGTTREAPAPARVEVRADNGMDGTAAWRDILFLLRRRDRRDLFKESQVSTT